MIQPDIAAPGRGDPRTIAFTDGACRGNPGPGGWGVWLLHWQASGRWATREEFGGEPATTNNRMELLAAIQALGALKRNTKITIYTDSTYLRDGITQWLPSWMARGWKTASKQAVKNADLWQQLDAARQPHDVDWQWVRGHNGHPGNEYADFLARKAVP